jgi:Secretion system C-terminal sorting domain
LVCDPEACWAPVRTESDFDLEANESGPFYLDVFPEGKVGTAYIKVKMFEVGKPANFITLRYRFNGQVVGVEEIEATKLRLFPNPTADYFVLEGSAPLTTVDVLSVTGQVLKTFPYVANEIYEIEDLTAGTYFLNLNGENNKRLATKRLIKQ